MAVALDPPLDLDALALRWERALDSADSALHAAGGELPDVAARVGALAEERARTARQLADVARDAGVQPAPWLSPVPVHATMLGLPPTTRACVFELDDVLTDSSVLHANAWASVFDELLMRLAEQTDRHFIPFDRDADYRDYIDGRPRLEGIHAFLSSRGIRLPEGRPDDLPNADTAYGIARHKSETLAHGLRRRGVTARAGARRYLQAAGYAGLERAVLSASASTVPILELAGLDTLVEMHLDADVIGDEGLRSRPAPDMLLSACRHVGVRPEDAVAFTHSPAGVAAAHAAGVGVIGVGNDARRELLSGFGAERVIPSVGALLDRRLAAPTL